jgi:fructose-1,6-bisphosphatase class II
MIDPSRLTPHLLERITLTSLQNTTAAAALQAAHARGRDNRDWADDLAVSAMREVLNNELLVPAEIVIGEGERDEAPMLYQGERLGPDDPSLPLLKIAVDPLEGTNLCARGEAGAISVIAAALQGEGDLMGGIDGYMEKIVIGRDLRERLDSMRVSAGHTHPYDYFRDLLDVPIPDLIRWISLQRRKPVPDIVAMVLERDRNHSIIEALRKMDVQIKLIRDGDITAGLLALDPNHDVDITMGIGAAPEGVVTAAIANVYGGYMESRWWIPTDQRAKDHRKRIKAGGHNLEKIYRIEDLAPGNVMFSLTSITSNDFMPGVQYKAGGVAITHTISGRSRTGTINRRTSWHPKPPVLPRSK